MRVYTMMNINYPYLPDGRQILYVPSDNAFMKEAKKVCDDFSTDKNHPTGAVIVQNGAIIGVGANQSAFKNPKLLSLHKNGWCVRRKLKIKTGTKYWLCPGCSSFRHHAEARAVKDAINKHKNAENSDLYLWGHWWCCKPCWDKMIKANIKNVYVLENSQNIFNF